MRPARVIEIEENTTPAQAISKSDRLKQLYGSFFSDSAQRSKERFSNTFRRNASPISTPRRGDSTFNDNDYDYLDGFDQQALGAQNRPVFVQSPRNPTPVGQTKVFTLFFSGKVPGEYTTKLTRLPVGPDGQPLTRGKRDVEDQLESAILPSKVQPILKTDSPSIPESPDEWNSINMRDGVLLIDSLLDELNELQSSMGATLPAKNSVSTVTLTETLTKTLCKNDLS